MKILLCVYAALWVMAAQAHPGGLNSEGCHNNRKTGDYHCHRAKAPPPAQQRQNLRPQHEQTKQGGQPGDGTCYTGPRGGTYTITKSGRKNYSGC